MVDEDQIRPVAAADPHICEELNWVKRLACVVVDLRWAPAELVGELPADAWIRKAPKSLVTRIRRPPNNRRQVRKDGLPDPGVWCHLTTTFRPTSGSITV